MQTLQAFLIELGVLHINLPINNEVSSVSPLKKTKPDIMIMNLKAFQVFLVVYFVR